MMKSAGGLQATVESPSFELIRSRTLLVKTHRGGKVAEAKRPDLRGGCLKPDFLCGGLGLGLTDNEVCLVRPRRPTQKIAHLDRGHFQNHLLKVRGNEKMFRPR